MPDALQHILAWTLTAFLVVLLSSCGNLHASDEPPAHYYNAADATDADTLRQTLHELIDDHDRLPYTANATDTWDVLEAADEHPFDMSKILDIYKNASYPKAGAGNANYSREHSWPKSYGFPKYDADNYPYSDCHHLFLVDRRYNSSRHNKLYRSCKESCTERPTEQIHQNGVLSNKYRGLSNWTATGIWEVWIGRRGDIARALFYMDVRYEGGTHSETGVVEPDLVLTDDLSLVVSSTNNQPRAYMGRLSDLLQWHLHDPVDKREEERNQVVFEAQGNRNPFIDHPQWVQCVFRNQCSDLSRR